jgi:hypothetical protein
MRRTMREVRDTGRNGVYPIRQSPLSGSREQAVESLPAILAERHHKTIPINAQALRRGADFILWHA